MIDRGLLKHIVKFELSLRKPAFRYYLIIAPAFLLVYFDKILSKQQGLVMYAILGIFIPTLIASRNLILPSLANGTLNDSQSSSFSWKYLHVINSKRKTFVLADVISFFISILPMFVFSIILIIDLKLNLNYLIILFPLTLTILLTKTSYLISVIEMDRKSYHNYSSENKKEWFLAVLNLSIHAIQKVSLFAGFLLFIKFFYEYDISFAFLFYTSSIIIFNILSYKKLFDVWRDERKSFWKLNKKYPVVIINLLIFFLSYQLNHKVHGHIIRYDSDIVKFIEDGKLKKFKELKIDKIKNDAFGKYGRGLIHHSIIYNKLDFVKYLLDQGSDINLRIKDEIKYEYFKFHIGMTPLLFALNYRRPKIVEYLIKHGADINARSDTKENAFVISTRRCLLNEMKYFIKKGADYNEIFPKFGTAFFYAVRGKCLTAIEYLKSIGANEFIKNKEGLTYLEYAKKEFPVFYEELIFYKKEILK